MKSEDSKEVVQSAQNGSKPYIGISLLILSLLLVVSVSALVYQTVTTHQACAVYTEPSINMKSTVTFKAGDDKEVLDEIEYDRTHNVAYYRGDDGSFEVDDFAKGIHLIREPLSRVCYLIPVGTTNVSGSDFETTLQKNDGANIPVTSLPAYDDGTQAEILPGEITDISFIPAGAYKECVRGYRWISYAPSTTDTNDEGRQKRDTCVFYVCPRTVSRGRCSWTWPYCWYQRCTRFIVPCYPDRVYM